ncbi:hypothetical protein G436_0667 [Leptospira interrogans serovar Hardjo str. Norma]|uniref:Uncharacterized protein n=1 Tax=Leptospira interrogans serovar Hardjo str. Norma TaxID=1279460 RepID=A0A0M5LAH0_LEPIR|nr:hypothetical protein G436_0667 [Leptospira interrogans serovar Hardjo str. Norma]
MWELLQIQVLQLDFENVGTHTKSKGFKITLKIYYSGV